MLCIVERTGGGEEREDPAPGTGVQEHTEEYWVSSPHGQTEGTQSVREGAHGAMGRRIDPSWGGHTELFLVPAIAHEM